MEQDEEFHWTWEGWLERVRHIARTHGWDEEDIEREIEQKQAAWRAMFAKEVTPVTAFIEATWQ